MRRRFFRTVFALSGILSGILLTSCVPPKKVSFYPLIYRSQQYLRAGDFQKAIDTCQATFDAYPDAQTVLDNYIKILQEIKVSADRFFETKDFVSAIRIYSLLSRNFPRFQSFEKSLPFTKRFLDARLRNSGNGISERQARQAFEAGDSDKAIEVYNTRYLENPDDADWLVGFVSILEEIKRTGDGSFSIKNFVLAGRAYSSLLKYFKSFEKFRASLSFSAKSLDEGVKVCRTELHKKALEQYRKENLIEAISIWQGLLTFDPDNVEAKKAVETATIQLKKTKKLANSLPKQA
jgi:tetratricopeptide (TPR) repeat protein